MTTGSIKSNTARRELSHVEFHFVGHDFATLAKLVKNESGIVLATEKMPLVYARLAPRLRLLGLKSFRNYCNFVESDEGASERRRMIEALTTNVTRFFREAHHFKYLKNEVLPELIQRARAGERIRIWSAGSSSGEEAYSIALTVLSLMPDASECDIKILGTDIDRAVLHKAREGVYSHRAIASISTDLRDRWFEQYETVDDERLWQVKPELRGLVTFRLANLIGPWPMRGPFQVVVCRNTVIYFDEASRTEIWTKMAGLIPVGGHLFIGHSERLPAGLSCFQPVGLTTFLRNGGAVPEATTSDAKERSDA